MKHRKAAGFGDDGTSPEEDVDVLLKYHNKMQERLADEMVHLARSLKENAEAAGRIVRDDKEVVASFSYNMRRRIYCNNISKGGACLVQYPGMCGGTLCVKRLTLV